MWRDLKLRTYLDEVGGSTHGGQAHCGIRVGEAGPEDFMQSGQVLSQDGCQLGGQLCKHEQGPLHKAGIPALGTVEQEWKQLWPARGLKNGHGKLCHGVTNLEVACHAFVSRLDGCHLADGNSGWSYRPHTADDLQMDQARH